jgi:hypothetical protein
MPYVGAFGERGTGIPSRARSYLCHVLSSFFCKLFKNGVPNLLLSTFSLLDFLDDLLLHR